MTILSIILVSRFMFCSSPCELPFRIANNGIICRPKRHNGYPRQVLGPGYASIVCKDEMLCLLGLAMGQAEGVRSRSKIGWVEQVLFSSQLIERWWCQKNRWIPLDSFKHLHILATTTNPNAMKAGRRANLQMINFCDLPGWVHQATCVCSATKRRTDRPGQCLLKDETCRVRLAKETWQRLDNKPKL